MKWLKVTLTASVPDMGRILLVSNVVVDSLGVKGKGPGMRVSRKRAHNQSKNALKKKNKLRSKKERERRDISGHPRGGAAHFQTSFFFK
jgi:hypothetical protein